MCVLEFVLVSAEYALSVLVEIDFDGLRVVFYVFFEGCSVCMRHGIRADAVYGQDDYLLYGRVTNSDVQHIFRSKQTDSIPHTPQMNGWLEMQGKVGRTDNPTITVTV